MQALIRLAGWIDALNERIGRAAMWLVLICVLISAGNAAVRKAFDLSSNGWLEIQWYLFSAIFLLGGGYTLRHNEHIRIDILSGRLSPKQRAIIDLLGGLFFLLPMALLIIYHATPVAWQMFQSNEHSADAGGLLRWPVWALIPLGMALLALQGLAEIIKRLAFLRGHIADPAPLQHEATAASLMTEGSAR